MKQHIPAETCFEILSNVLSEIAENIPDTNAQAQGVITRMLDTMQRKGRDYAAGKHTWQNFERSAILIGYEAEVGVSFRQLIGTKIARLVNLLPVPDEVLAGEATFKSLNIVAPVHESLEDTWLDLANYLILYVGYADWRRMFIENHWDYFPYVAPFPEFDTTLIIRNLDGALQHQTMIRLLSALMHGDREVYNLRRARIAEGFNEFTFFGELRRYQWLNMAQQCILLQAALEVQPS